MGKDRDKRQSEREPRGSDWMLAIFAVAILASIFSKPQREREDNQSTKNTRGLRRLFHR